jgi:hypothetical protein
VRAHELWLPRQRVRAGRQRLGPSQLGLARHPCRGGTAPVDHAAREHRAQPGGQRARARRACRDEGVQGVLDGIVRVRVAAEQASGQSLQVAFVCEERGRIER